MIVYLVKCYAVQDILVVSVVTPHQLYYGKCSDILVFYSHDPLYGYGCVWVKVTMKL